MAIAVRKWAWWSWAGLGIVAGAVVLSEAGTRFGRVYLTPLAWTGVVLTVDGWLDAAHRSWLRSRPRSMLLTALVSVPSWCLFELYDRPRFWRANGPELWWHYHNLPPWPERGIGYVWAFATITPAVLLLGRLLEPAAARLVGRGRGGRVPVELLLALALVGLVLAVVPLLWPSPYFAADVWLAWALLLDPINRLCGRPSCVGDLERGNRARPVSLLLGGLVAGVLWESINWLAGARWTYTVPFGGHLKLFEMPVLGFLGFAPFAIECFAICAFLTRGAIDVTSESDGLG